MLSRILAKPLQENVVAIVYLVGEEDFDNPLLQIAETLDSIL